MASDPSGIMRVRETSPTIFATRQMAADTRLCALSHFNFNCSARLQIILMHAETAGRYLYDGIRTILIKILMQAALAGVIVSTKLLPPRAQGSHAHYS